MKNNDIAIYSLIAQNEILKKRVKELQERIDEVSDSYELELEVSGVIIRTDVKHLEEVLIELYKISRELN